MLRGIGAGLTLRGNVRRIGTLGEPPALVSNDSAASGVPLSEHPVVDQ
jgi:hypothetical protein